MTSEAIAMYGQEGINPGVHHGGPRKVRPFQFDHCFGIDKLLELRFALRGLWAHRESINCFLRQTHFSSSQHNTANGGGCSSPFQKKGREPGQSFKRSLVTTPSWSRMLMPTPTACACTYTNVHVILHTGRRHFAATPRSGRLTVSISQGSLIDVTAMVAVVCPSLPHW